MFSLFMPVGHIATVRDLGNAAETNKLMELHKHRVHAPLLLAENLGRSAIYNVQRSIKKLIARSF